MFFDLGLLAPILGGIGLLAAMIVLFVIKKRVPINHQALLNLNHDLKVSFKALLRSVTKGMFLVWFVFAVALHFWVSFESAAAFALGGLVTFIGLILGQLLQLEVSMAVPLLMSKKNHTQVFKYGFFVSGLVGLVSFSLLMIAIGGGFYFFQTETIWPQLLTAYLLGVALVSGYFIVGGSLFQQGAEIGSNYVAQIEIGITGEDARNPGAVAQQVGQQVVGGLVSGAAYLLCFTMSLVICTLIAAHLSADELTQNFAGVSKDLMMSLPILIGAMGLAAKLMGMICSLLIFKIEKRWMSNMSQALIQMVFLGTAVYFVYTAGYSENLLFVLPISVFFSVATEILTYVVTRERRRRSMLACLTGGTTRTLIYSWARGFQVLTVFIALLCLSLYGVYQLSGEYGLALFCVTGFAAMTISNTFQQLKATYSFSIRSCEMAQLGKNVAIEYAVPVMHAIRQSSAYRTHFYLLVPLMLYLSYFVSLDQAKTIEVPAESSHIFYALGLFAGFVAFLYLISWLFKSLDSLVEQIVQEVRRQYREIPGLLSGTGRPDVVKCVELVAKKSTQVFYFLALPLILLAVSALYMLDHRISYGLIWSGALLVLLLAQQYQGISTMSELTQKSLDTKQLDVTRRGSDIYNSAVVSAGHFGALNDLLVPSLFAFAVLFATIAVFVTRGVS